MAFGHRGFHEVTAEELCSSDDQYLHAHLLRRVHLIRCLQTDADQHLYATILSQQRFTSNGAQCLFRNHTNPLRVRNFTRFSVLTLGGAH